MSVQRHYVTVGDRQVHYRRAGSGPPVILLHESPLSSLMYAELAERLAGTFTALALDTPGYGESDPLPLPAPDIADYADALAETLDALGVAPLRRLRRAHRRGIALEFAARHPERVAAWSLDGLALFTERGAARRCSSTIARGSTRSSTAATSRARGRCGATSTCSSRGSTAATRRG